MKHIAKLDFSLKNSLDTIHLFVQVKNKKNKFTFLEKPQITNSLFLKATIFAIRNRLKILSINNADYEDYTDINKIHYTILENEIGYYVVMCHIKDNNVNYSILEYEYLWPTVTLIESKLKKSFFNRILCYVNRFKNNIIK
jgi:hypothetical protein